MENNLQIQELIDMFDHFYKEKATAKNTSSRPNSLINTSDYNYHEENTMVAHNEILEIETFIKDEEEYCKILEDVIENYIKTVTTTKFEVMEIFGRIDLLYSYQRNSFLPDIKNCFSKMDIASCFIKHRKLFKNYYTNYFINQPNMIFIMSGNKEVFMGMQSEEMFKVREDILVHSLSERVEYYQVFLNQVKDGLENSSESASNLPVDRAIAIIEALTKFLLIDGNISFIISELVETERLYLNKLKSLIDVTYPKIKHNIKQKSKQKTLIGITPQIYKTQLHFYEDLKKCLFDFNPNEVGDCFLQYRNHFSLYIKDNLLKNNYDVLEECIGFLKEESKSFEPNTPLNRLYKYRLLLQALQKNCEKNSRPCESVANAVNAVFEIINKINHNSPIGLIKDENICLEEQGDLIFRELFTIQENDKSYKGMVFLFQKCVVFTETRDEQSTKKFKISSYVYKNHIIAKYLAINVVEKSSNTFQLGFFGKFNKRSFILKARDESIKTLWINKISEILMKQLLEEKDND